LAQRLSFAAALDRAFPEGICFLWLCPLALISFLFHCSRFLRKALWRVAGKNTKNSLFCLFYSSFMRKKRQVSTRAGVLLRVVFAIGSNQVVFRRIGTNGSSFQKIPHVLQWNH